MFASQLWCTWPGCLWSKLDSGCLQESLRWSDPLLTALLAWTELFWNCPNNNFAAAKTSYSKICSGSSSLDSKACFPWKSYSYFQDLTFTLKCFSLNPSLQQPNQAHRQCPQSKIYYSWIDFVAMRRSWKERACWEMGGTGAWCL